MLKETPSQTAGPYVHIGCIPQYAGVEGIYPNDPGCALPAGSQGTPIRLQGKVFDGNNDVVKDALIELWQRDGHGDKGIWLRQPTDLASGFYQFDTVKPAAVFGAPHVCLWIVARGINLGLHTRAYFPDEPENGHDPVLARPDQGDTRSYQPAPTRKKTSAIPASPSIASTFDCKERGRRCSWMFSRSALIVCASL